MEAGHPTDFIFTAKRAQMNVKVRVTPNTVRASPVCACSLFSEMVILPEQRAARGKWPHGKRSSG